MLCTNTQQGAQSEDQSQDLLILSMMLYHQATTLPSYKPDFSGYLNHTYHGESFLLKYDSIVTPLCFYWWITRYVARVGVSSSAQKYCQELRQTRCQSDDNYKQSFKHNSLTVQGFFLAILGRGPRAFLIGKISDVNPEFGKFSEYSKLIIFSKLT